MSNLATAAGNAMVNLFGCDPMMASSIASDSGHQTEVHEMVFEFGLPLGVAKLYSAHMRPNMDRQKYTDLHEAICLEVLSMAQLGTIALIGLNCAQLHRLGMHRQERFYEE